MAKLTNIRCEKLILDTQALPPNWNAAYGITQRRKNALLSDASNPNSFFNPTSETAMTVFMLGKLEGWGQAQLAHNHRPGCTPRNLDDGLDTEFFQRFAGPWISSSPRENGLGVFLAKRLSLNPTAMADPFLLFEVSTSSDAFNGGKTITNASFLVVDGESSCFNAITILPAARTLVFFDSKVEADGTHGASGHDLAQPLQHLETAFFLTTLPESQYCGWDFRYVLLCPRNAAKASKDCERFFLDGNDSQLNEYDLHLSNPATSKSISSNRTAYRPQWDVLRGKLKQHLEVIYWDDIMAELISLGFAPQNYLQNLAAIDRHDNKLVRATKRRWAVTGIESA
jgi:hypothetical protein